MSYSLREKRSRKPSSKHPIPDVSYYLPYVDDSETPEEIMKKFEILETIQKKKAESKQNNKEMEIEDQPREEEEILDDAELKELYMRIGANADDDGGDDDDFYEYNADDDADDDYYDVDYGDENKRSNRSSASIHMHFTKAKKLVDMVTSKALSRKCYRVDRDGDGKIAFVFVGDSPAPYPYEYIKVPSQIPLTWTHTVAPYEPPEESTTIHTDNPIMFDFTSLHKMFNVVYINTPLNYDCMNFKALSLPKRLIPTGFVFIWADKENIPEIINIFEDKSFFYVENLVWAECQDDNVLANENAPTLLRRCKRTLLLLRRGRKMSNGSISYDSIDMRHQRHPDVIMTPFSDNDQSILHRNVYDTIETLVPRGCVGGSQNSNDYLQLFGGVTFSRKVSIHIRINDSTGRMYLFNEIVI